MTMRHRFVAPAIALTARVARMAIAVVVAVLTTGLGLATREQLAATVRERNS